MTDKQLEIFIKLLLDKIEACEDIASAKRACDEIRVIISGKNESENVTYNLR